MPAHDRLAVAAGHVIASIASAKVLIARQQGRDKCNDVDSTLSRRSPAQRAQCACMRSELDPHSAGTASAAGTFVKRGSALSQAPTAGESGLCIVTGGSSGIGLATCSYFAEHGYQVMSVARRACNVVSCKSVLSDLTSDSGVDRVVDAVRSELNGSTTKICLVHNASNYPNDSAANVDAEGLEHAFLLNIKAPAVLTGKLLPFMAPGSCIVFVGSTLSEKAVPGKLSYCAVKHAMVGLMRATAQDLLWSGIHTAMVCPGITDTEMVRNAVTGREREFEQFVCELQGRLLEPEEVAAVIWNVAQSPVLHGTLMHCNNGQRER